MTIKHTFSLIILISISLFSYAEDGSRLWLRFAEQGNSGVKITSKQKSPGINIAAEELSKYWQGHPIELVIDKKLKQLKDGYRIKGNQQKITIYANQEYGLLYGAYHLLRLQQTNTNLNNVDLEEIPSYDIRILNHWDNLDRTVERGYAGFSLWKWDELPNILSPR